MERGLKEGIRKSITKILETINMIKIDNKSIDQVTKTKFLAVNINKHLNWSDHHHTVKRKITKVLVLFVVFDS